MHIYNTPHFQKVALFILAKPAHPKVIRHYDWALQIACRFLYGSSNT